MDTRRNIYVTKFGKIGEKTYACSFYVVKKDFKKLDYDKKVKFLKSIFNGVNQEFLTEGINKNIGWIFYNEINFELGEIEEKLFLNYMGCGKKGKKK